METSEIIAQINSIDTVFADKLNQIVGKEKIGFEKVRKNLSVLRSLDTAYLANEAYTKFQIPSNLFQYLELLRNSLILVPITLTWYSLAIAVSMFAKQSAEDLSPFLLLWQQGFGGQMPAFLRFSQIAIADAGLLGLIVIVTIILNVKTHIFDENALVKAMSLKHAVDQLLMKIEEDLYKKYAALAPTDEKNLEAIVAQFDKLATGVEAQNRSLLNYVAAEQERLSRLTDIQLANAKELQNAATTFYQAASDIVDTTRQLKEELHHWNELNEKNVVLLEKNTSEVSESFGKVVILSDSMSSLKTTVEQLNATHQSTFANINSSLDSFKVTIESLNNVLSASSMETSMDSLKATLQSFGNVLSTLKVFLEAPKDSVIEALPSKTLYPPVWAPLERDDARPLLNRNEDAITKISLQGICAYGSFIPVAGLCFGSVTLAWSLAEKLKTKFVYLGIAGLSFNVLLIVITVVLLR